MQTPRDTFSIALEQTQQPEQNRIQLLTGIFQQMRAFVPSERIRIFNLDHSGQRWSAWISYDFDEGFADAKSMALRRPVGPSEEYFLHQGGIMSLGQLQALQLLPAWGIDQITSRSAEILFTPLTAYRRKLGVLILETSREGTYSAEHLDLVHSFAHQITLSIADLVAQEEIQEREREKNALLSISAAIATIRDKEELWKVLIEKIKPLLGFEETVSTVYSEDYSQYRYMLFSGSVTERLDEQIKNSFREFMPMQGTSDEWILQQGDVCCLTMEEKAHIAHANPDVIEILKAAGIRQNLYIKLKTGGKVIGVQHFHFTDQQPVTPGILALAQSVTDLIAVALSNVMTLENLREREREKALLLSLSEDMATIRTRDDLALVVRERILPMVLAEDIVIITFHQEVACRYFITLASTARKNHPFFESVVRQEFAIQGSPVEEFLHQPEEVHYWSVEEYLTAYPTDTGLQLMQQTGLHHSLAIKLRWGGEMLGLLLLHYGHKEQIQPTRYALYKSIADQVAVAVANILANEEILEREREKALLLEISEAIASVRDTDDLLRIILDKIKPLFNFHDCGLFVLSEDGTTHTDLTMRPEVSPSLWNEALAQLSVNIPHRGSPIEWILRRLDEINRPVVVSFRELIERFPDYPQFKAINVLELGYQETLVTRLIARGRIIGVLCINSLSEQAFKPALFPLFQLVTDQVAVAVANILANEEILEREREKALLLEITRAVSHIQHKEQLQEALFARLQPLFAFHDATIVLAEEDEVHFRHLITNPAPEVDNSALQQLHAGGLYPITGSPYEQTFALPPGTVQIHNIRDWLKGYPAQGQAQMYEQAGYQQVMLAPLYVGKKLPGTLAFFSRTGHFTARHQLLFENAVGQVARAVANVLTHEQLLNREREKTMQIEVLKAFSEEADWAQKCLRAIKVIQPHLPFDFVISGLENTHLTGKGYGFHRVGFTEYRTLALEDMLRMGGLSLDQYTALRGKAQYPQSLLLNGPAFEDFCRRYPLKRIIAQIFHVRSNLSLRLKLGREGQFVLSFFSRDPNAYRPEHLLLLTRLERSLTLTLDKLLAYEEISKLSQQLRQENSYLQEEIHKTHNFTEVIGTSPQLQRVFSDLLQVAPTDTTVLILGETGTGKELMARAIHNASTRHDKVLIKVNCATLPATLIESELFGHEKGAFTGAVDRRIGKFELAHGGSIFLDEIGELPLELQAKLLRALQEKEIERLGGHKTIKADIRIIAATNRDLEHEVTQGRFRADLFFRLSIFPLHLPPLRERKADIPLLAMHFIQKFNRKLGKQIMNIAPATMEEMLAYPWPGNIRELENVIERGAILSSSPTLHLSLYPNKDKPAFTAPAAPILIPKSYQDGEREIILNAMRYCNWRIRGEGGASQLLQVRPSTLEARMKKLGIRRDPGSR